MIEKNKQNNNGFTIIETLVAVFILSVAITGPLVFAQSGLRAAFLARDQITALFLAQDAMESIKNMRDSNGVKSPKSAWLNGMTNCLDYVNGCQIDTTQTTPVLSQCLGAGGCNKMKYSDSAGYQYGSGDETIFKRTVYLSNALNTGSDPIPDQVRVVVKVTWQTHERIGERSIVVQENLFNWIK